MTDAPTPDAAPEPDVSLPSETVVPAAEAAADHPVDPGQTLFTTGYCQTCGLWAVKGFGGWQHAEEPPA